MHFSNLLHDNPSGGDAGGWLGKKGDVPKKMDVVRVGSKCHKWSQPVFFRLASSLDPSGTQRQSSPFWAWPPQGPRGGRRRVRRSFSPWKWHIWRNREHWGKLLCDRKTCSLADLKVCVKNFTHVGLEQRQVHGTFNRQNQKKHTWHSPACHFQIGVPFSPGHSWCCRAGSRRSAPVLPNCCWSPCPCHRTQKSTIWWFYLLRHSKKQNKKRFTLKLEILVLFPASANVLLTHLTMMSSLTLSPSPSSSSTLRVYLQHNTGCMLLGPFHYFHWINFTSSLYRHSGS